LRAICFAMDRNDPVQSHGRKDACKSYDNATISSRHCAPR
jgi:hypothetical protein